MTVPGFFHLQWRKDALPATSQLSKTHSLSIAADVNLRSTAQLLARRKTGPSTNMSASNLKQPQRLTPDLL